MIDLKPESAPLVSLCPFCGGQPQIDVYEEANTVYCVCTNCHATGPSVNVLENDQTGTPRDWIGAATANAVEAWNDRKNPWGIPQVGSKKVAPGTVKPVFP